MNETDRRALETFLDSKTNRRTQRAIWWAIVITGAAFWINRLFLHL